MQRITRNILPLLLSLVIFAGCDQIIEVDLPPHEPQLNINSTFNPDSLWFVNVSSSLGIVEAGDPEVVTNATVVVYADGAVLDTFVHFEDGFYVYPGAFQGESAEPGVNYEVRASAPGFQDVKGFGHVPEPVEILGGTWTSTYDSTTYLSGTKFDVRFQDPSESNYYFVALVPIDTTNMQNIILWPSYIMSNSPALGAEDVYSNYAFQGLVFGDESFNGSEANLEFETYEYGGPSGGVLMVILGTLSEDYYQYARSYSQFFENQFNPFAEPVMIHSNVDGGLGVFAGFSTHSYVLP